MITFLADENFDYWLIKKLRSEGIDIHSIVENLPGISDDEVLQLAITLDAILITEDKDFGELTYRLNKPSKGIILVRLAGVPKEEKLEILLKTLKTHIELIPDNFVVINERKIRFNAI